MSSCMVCFVLILAQNAQPSFSAGSIHFFHAKQPPRHHSCAPTHAQSILRTFIPLPKSAAGTLQVLLHAWHTRTGIISSGCCCAVLPRENRDSNLFRFSCCSSSAGCAVPDSSDGSVKLPLDLPLPSGPVPGLCDTWLPLLVVAAS